ncbi:DEAD/DEAH box helicase [Lactobacillus hamsteri]|uniref:Phage DEAD box family helicase n=1 Tax=Lactobacillus hamsteri DSM 5661 = JCM 6256 TaxID=1423754 RepID=A0A0R1YKC5_9LACO|nr:DEAD/DEAH box helicase [Lactobacillus hamsteri]KRM40395.1 phage DEAD box family helicase [Lactobacillus hamsteri DSM 5661 = JCM 6256]
MNKTLKDAILNGFYDDNYPGHELLGPQLLANNSDNKIWSTLRDELLKCKSFTWAVAFITQDMLVPFKVVMADLAKKNVTGTIITGDYLGFNNPRVFDELKKISNLKIKIASEAGFHAKGYLFEHEDYQTVIIGSANFTRSALISNYEWSLKISSNKEAALTKQFSDQIKGLEENSFDLTDEWLKNYRKNWVKPVNNHSEKNIISEKIKPNQMQQDALKNLQGLLAEKQTKGLIVSATGTGKTYLGAFAVKAYKPKRFLYVVHRRQIAEKSLQSFYQVIGGKQSDYGILSGNKHDVNKKYLFATVQTLSQDKILEQLPADYFDYILIDEAHRAAAPSYQKILCHFKPKFLLGMTATPERMDEQDVYKIFDYNLAYEIRLRDALEEKILTPFHYVGIQDYEENGEIIDDTTDLRYLTADKRVQYILKELNYYGYSGDRPRGLIFCSRQDEARELAEKLTATSHPAVALTNEDSEDKRGKTVTELEAGKIEYIVTVDLFNEGVDIPSLNQIVMLRNTQSSIVFIQQLGRGLRKYPNKQFVTVLDFIGNYKNNYLIPIALNNDTSRDKDRVRREIQIPDFVGLSTINFSQIASERILHSLDQVKLDSMRELRISYKELKQKLGRVPLLLDFYNYGSTSPLVFAKNHALAHYGDFLQKMGESVELTKKQSQILSFVTKELLSGKRVHELLLLKMLLNSDNRKISFDEYIEQLNKHHAYVDKDVLNSVDDILTLSFFDVKSGKTTKKEQYGGSSLINHDLLTYEFSPVMRNCLKNTAFKKLLMDVLETGLLLNQDYQNDQQFTIYKQYDRKDVCRLLNWPLDVSAPMYGYRVGENVTPIFITYKKDSEEKRNAVYDNQLSDGRSLRWYTRAPRHLSSDEVQRLLKPDMKLQLFVKRSDAVGKEFFYLGEGKVLQDTVKEEKIGPKKKSAVGMNLLLKRPLAPSMYKILFDN